MPRLARTWLPCARADLLDGIRRASCATSGRDRRDRARYRDARRRRAGGAGRRRQGHRAALRELGSDRRADGLAHGLQRSRSPAALRDAAVAALRQALRRGARRSAARSREQLRLARDPRALRRREQEYEGAGTRSIGCRTTPRPSRGAHCPRSRCRVPTILGRRSCATSGENLPGLLSLHRRGLPFKREGEDPTRMFAGEARPGAHQPALPLPVPWGSRRCGSRPPSTPSPSTGAIPAERPDIYGKVGNSGVSSAPWTTPRSSTRASTWARPRPRCR